MERVHLCGHSTSDIRIQTVAHNQRLMHTKGFLRQVKHGAPRLAGSSRHNARGVSHSGDHGTIAHHEATLRRQGRIQVARQINSTLANRQCRFRKLPPSCVRVMAVKDHCRVIISGVNNVETSITHQVFEGIRADNEHVRAGLRMTLRKQGSSLC